MKKITLLVLTFFAFTISFYASNDEATTLMPAVAVEAESGTLNRGATVQDCSSCSGGKHVGDLGGPPESAPNKYFASKVSVASAGTYTMNLFASSGDPRSIFIGVNGGAGTEVAVNSGDWTTPAMYTLTITLAEGTNMIKFYNDISFAPNIDKFELTLLSSTTCTDCIGPIEAEAGTLFGAASVENCDNCSGNQHVNELGYSDRTVTHTVTAPVAGSYKLYISYISGSERNMTIVVNGTDSYPSTYNSVDWNVVFVKEIDIVLNAGTNTIRFGNSSEWAPNIDKFRLQLASSLSVGDNKIDDMSVYPNPTTDDWNLNSKSRITSISVFNILGKKVIYTKPNSNQAKINSSNLQTGVYFSQITTDKGVISKKLVKN